MKYGSTRDLFTEVSGRVSRVTRLGDRDVAQITFFTFATWLAECLPLSPFLWIVAPPTASTGPLLQALGLLCRRVLFVTDLTLAGLRSLPMQLKPTVMTEVATPTRSLIRVLRASSRQGAHLVAGGRVLDLFCAKIIFANEPLRDPAMAGFPLEITLAPAREHVPLMDLKEAERVAAEFQAKFLMYRLVNHGRVTAPSLDLGKFTAPMQELAHSLAACIVGDEDLQSEILPLLKQRDSEIRVDRAALLECIVLEALLAACHDAQLGTLTVADLTQSVNTILAGRGAGPQVSREMVGWRLRALGLRTEFVTGGRKGLTLLDETRAAIHTLAASYGVRTLLLGPVNNLCAHCAALTVRSKGPRR